MSLLNSMYLGAAGQSGSSGDFNFRSACYNTYLGIGTLGSSKYNAIKDHILRVDPDFLTLNEMNNGARSLINSNLASELGLNHIAHAMGGNAPGYNPSLISKYPIINSRYVQSGSGGDEFRILFMFSEIDISSVSDKRLGIYSIHATPFSLGGAGESVNSAPYLEFERAVQFKRLTDDVLATQSANPTMEIIVQGDHNEDNFRTQTASFASPPSGIGITVGSGITYPMSYAQAPILQLSGAGLTTCDAKKLDGTYKTIIQESNPGFTTEHRLDYISHSSGIMNLGSEVLDSDVDSNSGLTKFNSPLSVGLSGTASDHNLVFADFIIN